jgi:hypothetical protein
MNDGNPSRVRGLLNFEKMRMMSDTVQSIMNMLRVDYQFPLDGRLQRYLQFAAIERSHEKLKEMSILCEVE